MAEETHLLEVGKGLKKRRLGHKKGSKAKKKPKVFRGRGEKVKIDNKMRKLFHKRASEYNSDDDDDDDDSATITGDENAMSEEVLDTNFAEEEGVDGQDAAEENEVSEDEEGEIQPGITKFTEGCKAFRIAFKTIMNKNISDDSLGPVLSGHKKLIAEKLAEEEAERKVKGEAKKEKHLVGEKGHVKPANFLDSHEKFLIGVATKGVLRKRRKEAFFSELGKTSSSMADTPTKVHSSTGPGNDEGPAWAPLRDNYMLANSKLKDWDKMPDTTVADDIGRMPQESSSDDD
ncbi:hypothetical protein L1049_008530 [Liquidambar formosana]|uniref:RRP15-like protein n=1 Tax=Liquidambar formosana TaxID=63359 RepID=A0AAP0S359_LIQFO